MRQDAHEQLKMQGRKRPPEAIYPSSHEKQKTWVTPSSELPSQEAHSSRSPPLGPDDAPKE
jgi:hypothetical protein